MYYMSTIIYLILFLKILEIFEFAHSCFKMKTHIIVLDLSIIYLIPFIIFFKQQQKILLLIKIQNNQFYSFSSNTL